MARNYANVEVSTDTFDTWLTRTNELITALRNQTLTANATALYADNVTGNSELIGAFGANIVAISANSTAGGLRGGNTSVSNILYITSNTRITPVGAGNTTVFRVGGNTTSSNTTIETSFFDVINSNTTISGNSSYVAIRVTGNSTFTNVSVNAISAYLTTNLVISGGLHTVAGNVNFDSGTLFVDQANNRVGINNTTPDASLTITGTANVSGNVVLGGALHAIAGNVNFDSGTLFVDSANNRVGVNNTSPDAALTITGTANVSSAFRVDGLSTLAGNINTPTANASSDINVGANVNLSTTRINVGNTTVNTFITSTAVETDGTLTVLGATTLSNTLGVTGLTTLSGNINTPTANASSDINVGANVNLSTTRINVGNSSVNTFITSSAIETDGTLTVLGITTLSDNVSVDSGTLFVDATNNRVGINNTSPDTSLTVTGTANITSTARFGGAVTIANTLATGNTTVTGFVSVSNTLTVTNNATFSNTIAVTGNATFSNTVEATGAVTFSNTIGVTGLATFATTNTTTLATIASANVTGTTSLRSDVVSNGAVTIANTLSVTGDTTFNSDYVITVTANSDIGTANAVVLSFPKATYSTVKLMVQAKKGTVTQMSEVIVAHDGTTARSTVYGAVVSPATNTGIINILSAINSANVEITAVQLGTTNCAIKVVAHLIK